MEAVEVMEAEEEPTEHHKPRRHGGPRRGKQKNNSLLRALCASVVKPNGEASYRANPIPDKSLAEESAGNDPGKPARRGRGTLRFDSRGVLRSQIARRDSCAFATFRSASPSCSSECFESFLIRSSSALASRTAYMACLILSASCSFTNRICEKRAHLANNFHNYHASPRVGSAEAIDSAFTRL